MIWHHSRSLIKRKNVSQQRGVVLMVLPVVVAGGIGIIVGVTLAQYAYKTMKRMKEEEGTVQTTSKNSKAPLQRIGIDIGSVFSKLALSKSDSPVIALENREGSYTTPSYILYDHDDISVGKLAFEKRYLKPNSVFHMLHLALGEVPRPVAQFLQLDPSQPLEYSYNTHVITPTSQYKRLVNDALRTVEAKTHLENTHFSIAHPNFLSSQQVQAMQNIASTQCKRPVSCIPDSIAVLIHLKEKLKDGNEYAVIDVGGHFTQFSVITYHAASPSSSVIKYATTDISLGADRINDLLVSHIASSYLAEHGIDLLTDAMAKQRLYDAVEIAKQQLSAQPSTKIYIPYLTAGSDGSVQDLNIELSRRTLEELCGQFGDNYINALQSLQTHPFDGVILVGGGAHIPLLRRLTSDTLKVQPIHVEQPQHAVATGAAMFSGILQEEDAKEEVAAA